MVRDDKTLTCTDCSTSFVFTAGEQALLYFQGRDEEPDRCPRCSRRGGQRRSRHPLPPALLPSPDA